MELFEAINQRKTIRDFENEVISKEILEKIISAGLKAPTNDHMRDWQFVVVTDKDVAVRLLECIPKGISDADMEQLIRNRKTIEGNQTSQTDRDQSSRQDSLE